MENCKKYERQYFMPPKFEYDWVKKVDGKTYTGKDVFSRDISRGDEVTEKAYRALNGEYKLYTGDIGDNITSVMMIPAGIIISIFLIYEIFGKSKEKEQEEQ